MNQTTYEHIDYEWLTRPTGDPFVDAGGYALQEFSAHFPDLDILQLIMKATDIFVDRWGGKINPFFLNSKITQPAFRGDRKKEETEKYFKSLLNDEHGVRGVCRVTGRQTMVFAGGRDNTILTGSNTFVNFHHHFDTGLMLSKEVLIRMFFLPLACEQLQGRISLISGSKPEIAEFFCSDVCKRNLYNIGTNMSESVLKAKASSPGTSLFRYADKIIHEKKKNFEEDSDALILYHFTNFGASPDLAIYQLPFQTLQFYGFTQKGKYKDHWNAFVSRYYKVGRSKYNEQDQTYLVEDRTTTHVVEREEYQYWRNRIYESLLNNKSILPEMLNHVRNHEFDFKIVKIYVNKIKNMKKETIEKIEQMADYIMKSNNEVGVERAIGKLDAVDSSYKLRRFVLNDIVAKYYKEGHEEAIVTVNDYAEYLFPDTDSWKETRDVLIIALYERLHERLKGSHGKVEVETETEDNNHI